MAELLRARPIPASVLTVNFAGEPLSTNLVNAIYEQTKVKRVYDLYGPTEDTTYSTFALRRPNEPATIGRPIAFTHAYVLDEHQRPVPDGLPGELYLGGDGLAREYLNLPELTAKKFIRNPFSDGLSPRLYRTGDIVKYLPDGNLKYLGRLDQQVKIRGYRIELGEVESHLCALPGIRSAVVVAREDATGDKQLVAYLVSTDLKCPEWPALRSALKESLPEHMLPAAGVWLEALPQTLNGKIDRQALPGS